MAFGSESQTLASGAHSNTPRSWNDFDSSWALILPTWSMRVLTVARSFSMIALNITNNFALTILPRDLANLNAQLYSPFSKWLRRRQLPFLIPLRRNLDILE